MQLQEKMKTLAIISLLMFCVIVTISAKSLVYVNPYVNLHKVGLHLQANKR